MTTSSQAAFSIPEFCENHRISRALFYLLQKEGKGPRVTKLERRSIISIEAAAEVAKAHGGNQPAIGSVRHPIMRANKTRAGRRWVSKIICAAMITRLPSSGNVF